MTNVETSRHAEREISGKQLNKATALRRTVLRLPAGWTALAAAGRVGRPPAGCSVQAAAHVHGRSVPQRAEAAGPFACTHALTVWGIMP